MKQLTPDQTIGLELLIVYGNFMRGHDVRGLLWGWLDAMKEKNPKLYAQRVELLERLGATARRLVKHENAVDV